MYTTVITLAIICLIGFIIYSYLEYQKENKILKGICPKCYTTTIVTEELPDCASGEWDCNVAWFCSDCHESGVVNHPTENDRYQPLYSLIDTNSLYTMIPTRKSESSCVYVAWYKKDVNPVERNSLTGLGQMIRC